MLRTTKCLYYSYLAVTLITSTSTLDFLLNNKSMVTPILILSIFPTPSNKLLKWLRLGTCPPCCPTYLLETDSVTLIDGSSVELLFVKVHDHRADLLMLLLVLEWHVLGRIIELKVHDVPLCVRESTVPLKDVFCLALVALVHLHKMLVLPIILVEACRIVRVLRYLCVAKVVQPLFE